MGVYEVREAIVSALRAAAALECSCEPAVRARGLARHVLADLTQVGLRVTRWRNPEPEPWAGVLHVAGPVFTSREYRRSCPGYIVEQRQACTRCGRELIRGKHLWFWFRPGEAVVTDSYGPSPHTFERWRRIGGTVWGDCIAPIDS